MKTKTLLIAGGLLLVESAATAAPSCGSCTGTAANGAPIKVGGINGNVAARAYFERVNAYGGIGGSRLNI